MNAVVTAHGAIRSRLIYVVGIPLIAAALSLPGMNESYELPIVLFFSCIQGLLVSRAAHESLLVVMGYSLIIPLFVLIPVVASSFADAEPGDLGRVVWAILLPCAASFACWLADRGYRRFRT